MAISIATFAQWGTLAVDGTGDGQNGGPGYLDGTKLEYMYDNTSDSIWFKVTVTNILTANYGINIIMDVDGGGATANWFGTNSSFAYNRIITAWVTSGTSGTVGMTDAAGFAAKDYTKLGKNNISIKVDAAHKEYILGMKRTDIFNDTVLKADVIAGVGSNQYWDDDVPNIGSGGIDITHTVSVEKISLADAGYDIYPNPANNTIYINRKTNNAPATVILYNNIGQTVFTGTIPKGQSAYSIDVKELPVSIYHLRLATDGKQVVQQIIKE